MSLTLTAGVLEEVLAHARACAPQECCGVVVGRNRCGDRSIRMTNTLASPTAYEVDPAELISVLRGLRETGEELLAIYHSHPEGASQPSRRDIEQAYYPEAAHLIVSLQDPQNPVMRAFRIIDGRAFEIEVHAIV